MPPLISLSEIRDYIQAAAAQRADPSDAALLRAVADTVEHVRVKDDGQASAAGTALARLPSGAFRVLLSSRRKAAGLSLRQLAERSRLAPNTIRNIESGRTRASQLAAARLARVPELGLLEFSGGSQAPRADTWLLPGYDRHALIAELQQVVMSPGGRLEQTSLYLDDVSAGDWLAVAGAPAFQDRFRALPLPTIADSIMAHTAGAALDLVALGPGDGRTEIELAKLLLKAQPTLDLKFSLLEISHTLLTIAYGRARAQMPQHVTIEALHGDFRNIVRYPVLRRALAPSRRRCYVLLGGTLANVESEVHFIRDGLSQCQAGDLAVIDFQVVWADPRNPAAVRRADPVFATGAPEAHARWFCGPLKRYGQGIEDCRVGIDLLTDCAIEGSYELDFYADATRGSEVHRYHLLRARRYEPAPLLTTFSRLGWQSESCLRYGPGDMAAVALLRKT